MYGDESEEPGRPESIEDQLDRKERHALDALAKIRRIREELRGKTQAYPWIDLEAFRDEARTIERTRAPTGIPSLDRALGGGLPGGVVFGLVGPPGSCKSVLAIQIGLKRARQNDGVLYAYAPDQGGSQPLTRLAATFGDVAGNDGAFQRFVTEVGPVLKVADERQSGVTMESFAQAVETAGDARAILIDTPQTVLTDADDEGERARIDSAMATARLIASKLLVPVFVANHANRAATAAKRKEDRNHPRSAALGSGKVEHRSQLMVFMEKVDREDELTEIELEVTKLSFGESIKPFRLILDAPRWELREIDMAEASRAREEHEEIEWERDLKKASDRVSEILKRFPEGLSTRSLEERCGGRATIHRQARIKMADESQIICEERAGKGGGMLWKLARKS